MNTEVAKTEKPKLQAGGRVEPFIPKTLAEIATVASAFIMAGLIPKSYVGKTDAETKSKVMLGIMKSLEVGLAPGTGINTIAIINGRPSIWGDGAVALIQQSGHLEWIKEHFEGEDFTGPLHEWPGEFAAVCEVKRRSNDEPVKRRFSVDDAKRAGLWAHPKKEPWHKYPKRMLAMRARAWCLRDLFADDLSGLSIVEEAQDIPMRDITPTDTSYLDDAPALPAPQKEGEVDQGLQQTLGDDPLALSLATSMPEAPDDDAPDDPLRERQPDQPTKKEAMEWRDAMHRFVADAPTADALTKLCDSHESQLAYLKEHYPTDSQNLEAMIDERFVVLNPLAVG